jgi:hypothetical protein
MVRGTLPSKKINPKAPRYSCGDHRMWAKIRCHAALNCENAVLSRPIVAYVLASLRGMPGRRQISR